MSKLPLAGLAFLSLVSLSACGSSGSPPPALPQVTSSEVSLPRCSRDYLREYDQANRSVRQALELLRKRASDAEDLDDRASETVSRACDRCGEFWSRHRDEACQMRMKDGGWKVLSFQQGDLRAGCDSLSQAYPGCNP